MLNYRNIRVLRNILRRMPDERCNMGHWLNAPADGVPPKRSERGVRTCGTTACLAGWAALKLAPTVDLPVKFADSGRALLASRMETLLVPLTWAKKHRLPYDEYYTAPRIGRTQYVMAEVENIGQRVLGFTASHRWRLFHRKPEKEGSKTAHLTDREWMVYQLDRLLAKEPKARPARKAAVRKSAKRMVTRHRKSLERLGR